MIVKDLKSYTFGKGGQAEVYLNKTCSVAIGKQGGRGIGVIVSETNANIIKAATKEELRGIFSELLKADHYNNGGEHYLLAMINNRPVIAGPLESSFSEDDKSDADLFDCVEKEGVKLPDPADALSALADGKIIED